MSVAVREGRLLELEAVSEDAQSGSQVKHTHSLELNPKPVYEHIPHH